MSAKSRASDVETRGVSDHGFIDSICFRDPNGYVIELTSTRDGRDAAMNPARNGARAKLDHWQAAKALFAETCGCLGSTVDDFLGVEVFVRNRAAIHYAGNRGAGRWNFRRTAS